MIITISNAQIETISTIAAKTSEVGRAIVTIATSEKAQNVYKTILTAIALTVAVIVIGLSKSAQYYWTEFVKPGSIVVTSYATGKARKAFSRERLSQWRQAAYMAAIGSAAALVVRVRCFNWSAA